MNGDRALPTISFGEDCTYSMLDSLLTGWAARVWLTDGVILPAVWVGTEFDDRRGADLTTLRVWSRADDDFTNTLRVMTDAITRIEVI